MAAAAWLARLQREDVCEADGLEFDAWLSASATHYAAYRRAVALWHEFGVAPEEIIARMAAEGSRKRSIGPSAGAMRSRRWMVGVGGMAVAASLALALMPGVFSHPPAQTYMTGKGEHRRVALEDGSIIDVNAETRLSVSYAARERRIVLGDGEAIFDVTRDERRPFIVEAGGRAVRVLGTQFDVRNRQGELMVTVARGRVQVQSGLSAGAGHSFVLTPGQSLKISAAGAEDLKTVDPQEAFSWRTGRLVYRGEPLVGVVADLNRQFAEQIEIGDPDLGKIPITGVIVLDDPNTIVSRLSLMLPIRTVPSERGLLLLRK